MCEDNVKKEEAKQIWAHFARFPLYEDLKDLYVRCVPKISSFEDKLQDVQNDLEK